MNNIFFLLSLLCILTASVLFAQEDSIGVAIPKDDASPLNFRKEYMFVNLKNEVRSTYNGDWQFLTMSTNNGEVIKEVNEREDKFIGEIESFTPIEEIKPLLVKGNRLHFPSYAIRDMKTDLIISTREFDYILKGKK